MKLSFDGIKSFFLGLDRKKITLLGIFFVVFLILDFYFILGAQIKANRNIYIKLNKLKKDLKTFKKDLSLMQESLKKKPQILPRTISEAELSWLMEVLYNLASQNRVEISQIKPQKETKSSVPFTGIISYLLQMNLNSDYNSLLNFIKAIEDHEVIMSVEELGINQNPTDIFKHNVNLILRIYVRK